VLVARRPARGPLSFLLPQHAGRPRADPWHTRLSTVIALRRDSSGERAREVSMVILTSSRSPNQGGLLVNGVSVAWDETAREVSERQVLPASRPARELRAAAADNRPAPSLLLLRPNGRLDRPAGRTRSVAFRLARHRGRLRRPACLVVPISSKQKSPKASGSRPLRTILDSAGRGPRDTSFAMAKRACRASEHGRVFVVPGRSAVAAGADCCFLPGMQKRHELRPRLPRPFHTGSDSAAGGGFRKAWRCGSVGVAPLGCGLDDALR
jgi:hypothetical protein